MAGNIEYNKDAQAVYSGSWLELVRPDDSIYDPGTFADDYNKIIADIDKGPEGKTETGEGLNWLAVSGFKKDEFNTAVSTVTGDFQLCNRDQQMTSQEPCDEPSFKDGYTSDLYLEHKLGIAGGGDYSSIASMLTASSET